jgi:hypothetical protein
VNNIAIQLKSTSTKFNFNSLQLHNWIKNQLKTNGMQIGKDSKSSFEYGVGKEKLLKYTIPCVFTWEWTKQLLAWNCPIHNDNDLWNLKFYDLN